MGNCVESSSDYRGKTRRAWTVAGCGTCMQAAENTFLRALLFGRPRTLVQTSWSHEGRVVFCSTFSIFCACPCIQMRALRASRWQIATLEGEEIVRTCSKSLTCGS